MAKEAAVAEEKSDSKPITLSFRDEFSDDRPLDDKKILEIIAAWARKAPDVEAINLTYAPLQFLCKLSKTLKDYVNVKLLIIDEFQALICDSVVYQDAQDNFKSMVSLKTIRVERINMATKGGGDLSHVIKFCKLFPNLEATNLPNNILAVNAGKSAEAYAFAVTEEQKSIQGSNEERSGVAMTPYVELVSLIAMSAAGSDVVAED